MRKDKSFHKILARAAALALVVGVVGGGSFQIMDHLGAKYLMQNQVVNAAEKEEKVFTVADVAAYTMPGMVAITNKSVQEIQQYFFGQTYRYEEEYESNGSGVIIDQNEDELLIVTNNHVVEDATTLTVCFTVEAEDADDLVVSAEIKGTDPNNDLAIITVKLDDISDEVKSKIKVIEVGSSDEMALGEQVVAIGNALGYGQSVTAGYVSAKDREVTIDGITINMLQTDAAINPGNSGGALLNMQGELIGINSAKASDYGVEGMGYAIPTDTAIPIIEELKAIQARELVEEENRGYMGIMPRDVTEEARQIYNMPAGAFVYEVTEGSAAEESGMKRGDIITKMDGVIISSSANLYERMKYYAAGDELTVTVQRAQAGEYVEVVLTVILDEKPEDATGSTGSRNPYDREEEKETETETETEEVNEEIRDPFSQLFPEYFRNGR